MGTSVARTVSAGCVMPKQNGGSPGRLGAFASASNATTQRVSIKLSATVSSGHFTLGYRNSARRLFVTPGMELRHPCIASSAPAPCVVVVARRITRSLAACSSRRFTGGPVHRDGEEATEGGGGGASSSSGADDRAAIDVAPSRRLRGVTLVPIRPRSRGERRSLRTRRGDDAHDDDASVVAVRAASVEEAIVAFGRTRGGARLE
jgi:hypothetical protein